MTMRTAMFLFFVVAVVLVGPICVGAQVVEGRPSLVGKWILDTERSSDRVRKLPDSQILQISYEEPKLVIEETQTMNGETLSATIVLFTDNRGEMNRPSSFASGSLKVNSKTKWSKKLLISEYTLETPTSGGETIGGLLVKETYRLSSDGARLTIVEEIRTAPGRFGGDLMGPMPSKRIYTKSN